MSHEHTFDSPRESALDTDDRRHHTRHASEATVKVSLDTRELSGRADNLSKGGLLFFSEGDLRVRVEIVEHGKREIREGRLIRAQRIREDEIGWAVEFDPS